jgi:hypothetical protein
MIKSPAVYNPRDSHASTSAVLENSIRAHSRNSRIALSRLQKIRCLALAGFPGFPVAVNLGLIHERPVPAVDKAAEL